MQNMPTNGEKNVHSACPGFCCADALILEVRGGGVTAAHSSNHNIPEGGPSQEGRFGMETMIRQPARIYRV